LLNDFTFGMHVFAIEPFGCNTDTLISVHYIEVCSSVMGW